MNSRFNYLSRQLNLTRAFNLYPTFYSTTARTNATSEQKERRRPCRLITEIKVCSTVAIQDIPDSIHPQLALRHGYE